MTKQAADTKAQDWRVGLFFHTFYPAASGPEWVGKPQHQGQVLRQVGPEALEVLYFSWLMGDPLNREVKPLSYFEGAAFYPTDQEMVRAGAQLMGNDAEAAVEHHTEMKRLVDGDPREAPQPPAPKGAKIEKRAVSKKLRFDIFNRDHFTCTYCGRRAGPEVQLELDHKVPLSKGGKDEEPNLTTSCRDCNQEKRDKLLLDGGT